MHVYSTIFGKVMKMEFISVFEVLGPAMIGPSSSHTAGADQMAYLAQQIFGEPVKSVVFTLYGSFARTYRGHGTDRALLGGILGFQTDDRRIPDSFRLARERGVSFSFVPDKETKDVYPNTADIEMTGENGKKMTVRGESIGGGKVRITRINGIDVMFTGEYSTLIISQRDLPGVVAHITKCLADRNVNIAFMRLYRQSKHEKAFTIVESDEELPDVISDEICTNPNVSDVMLVQMPSKTRRAEGSRDAGNAAASGAADVESIAAETSVDGTGAIGVGVSGPTVSGDVTVTAASGAEEVIAAAREERTGKDDESVDSGIGADFTSAEELLGICELEKIPISEAMIRREIEAGGSARGDALGQMARFYQIMKESAKADPGKALRTMGNLIGSESGLVSGLAGAGKNICGETVSRAIAYSMRVLEVNASMGLIVAAPTAGSSGVIPGVLLAIQEAYDFPDSRMVRSLFNAGAVGYLAMRNATVAGAVGGCQAEIGVAAAMAASAVVELMGGTPRACLDAASTVLMNMLGLVCDPVAGLVEYPCQSRNASGAANALVAAEIALSGVRQLIPLDQMIAVMYQVGRGLPAELRETAEGGCAASPAGRSCAACIFDAAAEK